MTTSLVEAANILMNVSGSVWETVYDNYGAIDQINTEAFALENAMFVNFTPPTAILYR